MTRTVEGPERIWLIRDAGSVDAAWADNPNPYAEYGEEPEAAIEYVRADVWDVWQSRVVGLQAALRRIAEMTDIEADFDGFEAREIARAALRTGDDVR